MCQPVITPAGRVRELSPSSPVVPSGAPRFGSWLPGPLPTGELAPGYRGAGQNIWLSWPPPPRHARNTGHDTDPGPAGARQRVHDGVPPGGRATELASAGRWGTGAPRWPRNGLQQPSWRVCAKQTTRALRSRPGPGVAAGRRCQYSSSTVYTEVSFPLPGLRCQRRVAATEQSSFFLSCSRSRNDVRGGSMARPQPPQSGAGLPQPPPPSRR